MFYPHFSVLSPFQRFIPISAFYPHFSVLSPFQRFIPISAFYPYFSVLSPFQFPLSVSVSAIQFQRFIPTRIAYCYTTLEQIRTNNVSGIETIESQNAKLIIHSSIYIFFHTFILNRRKLKITHLFFKCKL